MEARRDPVHRRRSGSTSAADSIATADESSDEDPPMFSSPARRDAFVKFAGYVSLKPTDGA
jgi:hypothetical protein